MPQHNITIILSSIVVILVIGIVFQALRYNTRQVPVMVPVGQEPEPTPTPIPVPQVSYAPDSWKTWQDGAYVAGTDTYFGYSLTYPRDFDVRQGDQANGNLIGTAHVDIAFPQDAFRTPTSNYNEAYLVVSIGDAEQAVANCYQNPSPAVGGDAQPLTQTQSINGITFHKGNAVDVGAGNIYTSEVYHTIQDNRCYEILLTVHTGNIGNYTPGTVVEFDKEKAYTVLRQILNTFTFTNKNPY